MLNVWSQPVLDGWYEVLDSIMKNLSNFESIYKDIQVLTLSLSEFTQPAASRYIACRIIGSLAEVQKDRMKGPIFDKARVIC